MIKSNNNSKDKIKNDSKFVFFQKKEYILILLILSSFIVGYFGYQNLSDKIPTHWNAQGVADGYSSKLFGILFIPLIMIFIYVLLLIVPLFDVYKENIYKFWNHYFVFRTSIIIFLFALYVATIVQAYNPFNMTYVMIPLISFLLFMSGFLFKHIKRNFSIGIRTQWTLVSDEVWEKTHILGSKLFISYSLILLLFLFFDSYFFIYGLIIPLIGIIVFILAYSYILYKQSFKKKL